MDEAGRRLVAGAVPLGLLGKLSRLWAQVRTGQPPEARLASSLDSGAQPARPRVLHSGPA